MTSVFPWTTETKIQLLKGLAGNTSFKITWPWAPFHTPGFKALKWAAEKKMTAPQFYGTLRNLSCPSASGKVKRRLKNTKLIDQYDRIVPLDPGATITKTFVMASENISQFSSDDVILLTISELLAENPEFEKIWRPSALEEKALVDKWMLRDQSLVKSFQAASPWNQLKVIESLVGVSKASSVLNFERIY